MKFNITYSIPFSPDSEIRTKVFEETVSATDAQTARKKIYSKYHNANIISMKQMSFF